MPFMSQPAPTPLTPERFLGALHPYALGYLSGSHLYGLDHGGSDADYVFVYFIPAETVRPYPEFAEKFHNETNDWKGYSLTKVARALGNGNPNFTELAHFGQPDQLPHNAETRAVADFMAYMRPYTVNHRLAQAYASHARRVIGDATSKDGTPPDDLGKRLAHGIRTAQAALTLATRGELIDYRRHEQRAASAAAISGALSPADAVARIRELLDAAHYAIDENVAGLPPAQIARDAANAWFSTEMPRLLSR